MYAREEIPELRPPDLPDKPSFFPAIRRTRRLNELDDSHFREIQALYLGMISYNDWLLGEVLSCLAANGYEGNTTILFFSDHGDWA
ncbi:MAG: sulfatase-like hydrolase/transferase, partial [Armatimonadetes bacterium]|nr:sulfatase-like hydrolase/transferase [Armatimonadota bacterium]